MKSIWFYSREVHHWDHFHHPTAARGIFIKEKEVVPHICGPGKSFDKVPRPAIRWSLHRQVVPESLIDLVMALYSETRSLVRVAEETSDSFEIWVGLHQGVSAESFAIYISNGRGHRGM